MYSIGTKNIIFIILLFAVSYLMPVATAGFENCIYCHGTQTGGVPYVNLTSLNNSIHGQINNTDDPNYACYACHWDGTPPKNHAKNRSQIKTCEDCHVNNLFNVPSVTEHISNGQDINTSTGCILCHSSSIDANAGYNKISDRVAHFGTTADLMSPVIRSTNCTWCHFDNSGNIAWGTPEDPRASGIALNHTQFNSNAQCYSCHVYGGGVPPTFHDSSLGRGGGRDCIGCHDTGVDVLATNDSKSVHSSLNSNSATSLNRNNLRCWACHGDGDGSETSQPAGGHPLNYKTPKNCNNSDCHSISQSLYKETMIYSHFQNASLNNNPNNVTNYNITTEVQCQVCHINSLVKKDSSSGLALVSHYGSKEDLIDSFNCIYCHLDKDNSENWGNATLINKNSTSLIGRERNKFTVFEGESVYLGEGYILKVVEISIKREEAFIQILKNDSVMDEVSLGAGTPYIYEREITIDNSTLRTPAVILNITSIYKSDSNSFIQFEGLRLKKIHTDKESENSACYACHLYRYSEEKERYLVLDREYKENSDDVIYYTRVLIDFRSENKSKIYFNDEYKQKYLKEGETWNIADGYSLKLNEVSTDSKEVWLILTINNSIVESRIVPAGSEFKYTPGIRYKGYTATNVTVFTAKIADIFQGRPNFVILKDVLALSPHVMKTEAGANVTIFGYNSSWFKPDDTFAAGKIPSNLHSPNLYVDQRNWADCVRCHDTSKKLGISDVEAISSRLNRHFTLNINASNKTFLSDPIDKACWACHLDGSEPQIHSPAYIIPRNCTSCHTYQKKPYFGAVNISDELHGYETNCESCHIDNSHNLKMSVKRYEVSPVIKEASLSQTRVRKNESAKLVARATAGYKMKIRAAEYFLDKISSSGTGTPLKPFDGSFDSQIEEVTAEINTTGILTGVHIIYIHAMERNNRWGEFYQVNFTIVPTEPEAEASKSKNAAALDMISIIISLIAAYLKMKLLQ